ncbi:MAG: tyrosine-type recombinase/integrase [Kiritimatiellae bacterium]|nr:tyrosine-type recombinase/integrase [Kiritimatiellia bacterium]
MRISKGSIQRKNRRYYLVTRIAGKQKWLSLKTDSLPTAKARVAKLMANPLPDESEHGWLEWLGKVGESATRQLRELKAATVFSWENLHNVFMEAVKNDPPSATAAVTQKRWLDILRQEAEKIRAANPVSLTAGQAEDITGEIRTRYVSAPRMVSHYRRVWRKLGLPDGVWPRTRVSSSLPRQRYRRLSLAEVRRLLDNLRGDALEEAVIIGYYTGLRRSDIIQLEVSELSPSRDFLYIVPNKTRMRKHTPIHVPLIREARQIVRKRAENAARWLFPELVNRKVNRRLSAAFRQAGVLSNVSGRASFHSLRATFISMMDEGGVAPYITDAITGHAAGGMHARYTQPTDKALLDAVASAIAKL